MPYLEFAPFAPDNAQLNEDASAMMCNVFPGTGGFDPVPSLHALPALPEACLSLWGYADPAGEAYILAASGSCIYRFLHGGWLDVSRWGADGRPRPYTIAPETGWSFIAFQNVPMAAGLGDAPQIWDASLQRFRDLENKWQKPNKTDNITILPVPRARRIAANNEFVFLLDADEKPSRMYQSGTRQPEVWQTGQQQSAYEDFDTGGEVMAVSQGTSPLILLKKAIYQAHRAEIAGAFSFVKVATGLGCFYYGSDAVLNDAIFFLDENGFYMMTEGGQLKPIGFNKVNIWVREVLTTHIPHCKISAFADEKNMRIYWVFVPAGKAPVAPCAEFPLGNDWRGFALVYDLLRDEWTRLTHYGLAAAAVPWRAVALGELDKAQDPNSLDTQSLDSSIYDYNANIPAFLAADGRRVLLQCGGNEAAFLQTGWQGDTAQQMGGVNALQPVVDAPDFDAECRIRGDMTAGHTPFYTPWAKQSKIDGAVRMLFRGRTAKVQMRLPKGSAWAKAQGVNVSVLKMGRR